jgi:phosphoribosylamine--glycine ligase
MGPVSSATVQVLVIGSGAREHALLLALAADPAVDGLHAAPGNAGMTGLAVLHDVRATDASAVAGLADRLSVALVVVGPEAALAAGVADAVRAAGIPCFGASAAAARLESSKAFAKDVMAAAGVPTAAAVVCRDVASLRAALAAGPPPYVVKDDGLAAGKGVLVTDDLLAATAHGEAVLRGAPGATVLVEEFLDGPEVSLFFLADGERVAALVPAQDHKRLGDGDTGPNTGGMGASAPLPWAPPDLVDGVTRAVAEPVIRELARRGTPFSGLLYAGLALTSAGLRVVEFNARFGAPETQVVLPLLDAPLAGLLLAAATGRLPAGPVPVRSGAALTVVLAAPGYPQAPVTGDVVHGLAAAGAIAGVTVIHAGTALAADGSVRTAGGRVLSVTAVGADVAAARSAAYAAVDCLSFEGMQYRHDIAATVTDVAIKQGAS